LKVEKTEKMLAEHFPKLVNPLQYTSSRYARFGG